jgi:hypothetical protein
MSNTKATASKRVLRAAVVVIPRAVDILHATVTVLPVLLMMDVVAVFGHYLPQSIQLLFTTESRIQTVEAVFVSWTPLARLATL